MQRGWRRRLQKVIDDLHLNLRADQLVEELSIGMQQLVEIIKAVSAEARIVVMDEPTSSLSQGEVETLFDIIRLLKEKASVLFTYHTDWKSCLQSRIGLSFCVTAK